MTTGAASDAGTSYADIITDRLVLRRSDDERDLENYLSHLEASNEYYIQYGIERCDELVAMIDFHTAPVCYYTVFRQDTDAMVGYVGLCLTNRKPMMGDLEFYIFKEYRRDHFCREALTALIRCFFDGTLVGERGAAVAAETLRENEPSIRLLETLGFEKGAVGLSLTQNAGGGLSTGYEFARYILKNQAVG